MAITETRTRPPQFIEDIGVDLAKNLVASTGVPTETVGLSQISQRPGSQQMTLLQDNKQLEHLKLDNKV